MLDIKFIREHPDLVREGIQKKGAADSVDEVLRLDAHRRELLQKVEHLKSHRNMVSEEVGKLKRTGKDAATVIAEMETVKNQIKSIDDELRGVEETLHGFMLTIPNIPHPSVPVGTKPEHNQEVATWGEPPVIDFKPKPHWELVEKLDLIDFERGVKVAGAGFPVYKGQGAKLQRALINFFLDEGAAKGYQEIQPPLMVNAASATGTGQLPDKEDLMYVATKDDLYLIPTAEVPVTNIHRDEMFTEQQLPVKYCAYTPCFRREAGSYGKDVRGLNRLHQFDKVELVKYVHPGVSYNELESLREDAEQLLKKLGLQYRTLLMCTGDMGFTQSKKYDLETWSIGQQRWLEVSSISNFEAFQARRMNIRFRPRGDGKPEFVHTLNGSGLALPRVVATIIEHYQTPEGKVIVPKALHKYTGFEIIG
ncbi:MAG: serine--tRNA ligase [Ignavibacteria bacterium]|nr:serine--tRNA ligase [Ignavibacteria bacterium]MBI3765889.1 serine--tRNA ligase [Ignavibacteriales bacterium]